MLIQINYYLHVILFSLEMIKILAISLILLTVHVSAIEFTIEIQKRTRFCLNQFITQSTPFHFRSSATDGDYQLSLLFHDGTILKKNAEKGYPDKKVDSYAAVTSQYTFCIQNMANKQQFTIRFLQGIQLSDINDLPSIDDHKKIDSVVDALNTQYQTVKEQEHYSMTVNEFTMELQKLVSFKAVGFGFLSIIVIIAISFLHFLQIKRVLKNRKII